VDPILSIINSLKKAEKDVSEVILSGRIASFEDYKRQIGELEGIKKALYLVDESLKEDDNN
jgi:hypothetical protein